MTDQKKLIKKSMKRDIVKLAWLICIGMLWTKPNKETNKLARIRRVSFLFSCSNTSSVLWYRVFVSPIAPQFIERGFLGNWHLLSVSAISCYFSIADTRKLKKWTLIVSQRRNAARVETDPEGYRKICGLRIVEYTTYRFTGEYGDTTVTTTDGWKLDLE